MKAISQDTLVKLLLNPEISGINGASFIGIDTMTTEKLTGGKKNDQQGRVRKMTTSSSVMVFQNKNSNAYENMVKRRLEAEGKSTTFEVKPRVWGVRIEGTPLIEHNGRFYLEVIFLKSGDTSYMLDDQPIKKDLINGLPVKKASGQGGLNDQVIIRSFKIESLSRITINKETYLIVK